VKSTPLLLLIGVVAALAAPTAASAKNISELKLCGPSACGTITDKDVLERWMQAGDAGPTTTPQLARYYRFEVTVTAGPGEKFENGKTSMTWSQWYVPSQQAVRGESESGAAAWVKQSGRAAAVFADVVRGIEPYSAPAITSATVGRKTARDPASYARLFDPRWKLASDWSATDWRRIRLFSASPSPWTDGKNVLLYSPKKRTLSRDGTVVALPRSVAGRLTRARSLQGGSGHIHLAFATAGVVAVGLGIAAYWRRRRA
jgi:hypothetical protein